MTVAKISNAYLIGVFLIHLFSAALLSAMLAEWALGDISHGPWVFPFAYIACIGFSIYLMLQNGRWAVDSDNIYKGLNATPIIQRDEILGAQIGLPATWFTTISKLPIPKGRSLRDLENMRQSALLLELTDNRWFIWEFSGMSNREAFIDAVLKLSPAVGNLNVPPEIVGKLSITRVGKIIYG